MCYGDLEQRYYQELPQWLLDKLLDPYAQCAPALGLHVNCEHNRSVSIVPGATELTLVDSSPGGLDTQASTMMGLSIHPGRQPAAGRDATRRTPKCR